MVKVIDKYGLNRREINIITNLVSAYISVAEKDFKSMYHDYKKAPSPQTDFVGLVHTVKGVGKITTAENVYVLNRNDALFINYHDVISFESVDSEWEFYTLWFRVTNFKLDMNKIIYVAPLPNERETMETIINLLNTDEYMNCCKANTLAQRLILDVMAESFVDDSSFYVDSMRKIASYIHRNINDNISIKDLAKRCSVSKNHFCNLFKQYYKMLPKDYIQREKLKKAAFLLLNTAMPIQDISSELSYSSPAYFASCFKEFYKLTPTEFRQTESIEKKFLNVSVFFVYVLWLAKERSCSIDKALEMVKGLGYSAIEVDKDELIEYPTLADKILDKGLKVSSVYGYYNLMKEDTLDAFELIDFAVKCKSDVAMILPGAFQNEELTEDIISDQNKMREFLENNDSVYKFEIYADNGYVLKQNGQEVLQKRALGNGYVYTINTNLSSDYELDFTVEVDQNILGFRLELGNSAQGYDAEYAFNNNVIGRRSNVNASTVETVLVDAKTVNPNALDGEKYLQIKIGQTNNDNLKSEFVLKDSSIKSIDGTCKKLAIRIYNSSSESIDAGLAIRYGNNLRLYSVYSNFVINSGENVILIAGLDSFKWRQLLYIDEIKIELGKPRDPARDCIYFMDMSIYK